MVTNDATISRTRHDVLCGVTKLAWKGVLDERKEDIPYKLIPDPQARFRCCIYQEREIIRQRVRLAEGLCSADGKNTISIVQVIGAVREGYPIAQFTVTDSCQLCMGGTCRSSCNFGAISMERDRACIGPDRCKEYGKCTQACPYNTIASLIRSYRKACPVDTITTDENDLVEIGESKYIQCGACIHEYPSSAIDSESFMVGVIDIIRAGKKVVTMVVPATEGRFGADITVASWKTALKKIGSADMVGIGLGDGLTTAAGAAKQAEAYRDGEKMTASCCPTFVSIIKQHFPMLLGDMSATVPLMCAVSRILKEKGPETVTVFIGPRIAKKSETLDLNIKDSTDYALTYSEIRAAMKVKGVNLEPKENIYQGSSVSGRRFGSGSSMMAAVLECPKETGENMDIEVTKCSRAAECKKALMLLEVGRLPEDFVESMVCEGGCVGGPSKHKSKVETRKSRGILVGQADDRGVHANLKNLGATDVAMRRHQAEKGFRENMPRSFSFFR